MFHIRSSQNENDYKEKLFLSFSMRSKLSSKAILVRFILNNEMFAGNGFFDDNGVLRHHKTI